MCAHTHTCILGAGRRDGEPLVLHPGGIPPKDCPSPSSGDLPCKPGKCLLPPCHHPRPGVPALCPGLLSCPLCSRAWDCTCCTRSLSHSPLAMFLPGSRQSAHIWEAPREGAGRAGHGLQYKWQLFKPQMAPLLPRALSLTWCYLPQPCSQDCVPARVAWSRAWKIKSAGSLFLSQHPWGLEDMPSHLAPSMPLK